MIDEAARAGLKFEPSILTEYRALASADGRIYDSRSGLGFFYRYHPRTALSMMDDNPPIVDGSVILRMARGPDGYAPVSLSSNFLVRLPDGRIVPFKAPAEPCGAGATSGPDAQDTTRVEQALAELRSRHAQSPTSQADRAGIMLDTVWWRRFVYYILLSLLVVAAAYPVMAEYLAASDLTRLDDGAGPLVGQIVGVVEFFLPGFVKPWLTSIARHPSAAAALQSAAAPMMWLSAFLKTRIADRARIAWSSGTWRRNEARYKKERNQSHMRLAAAAAALAGGATAFAAASKTWYAAGIFLACAIGCLVSLLLTARDRRTRSSLLLSFARFMRTNRITVALYNVLRRDVLPALSLALAGILILALINNVLVSVASAAGAFCPPDNPPRETSESVGKATSSFHSGSMCWDTGMIVLKGERYKIQIDTSDDWRDASTPAGAAGFTAANVFHIVGWPLKRWWNAPYFQPIARVGSHGADEQALAPIRLQGEAHGIRSASFLLTPKETGRLYLYVNDAAFGVPGLFDFFYRNNHGTASVDVINASGY
jgi:hypothetical protein